MYKDFTLIIAGPIGRKLENLTRTLEVHYHNFEKIIISGWENDTSYFFPDYNDKITRIHSKIIPDNYLGIYNNLPKQITTTLEALKICKTKYILRIRSDERFHNLQPIIDNIIKYPERYNCCNIFFIKPNASRNSWGHVSDHLFGGSTEVFLRGFRNSWDDLDKFNSRQLSIEGYLFDCFLQGNGLHLPINKKKVLLEYTTVINIEDLKPYEWSCAGHYYQNDSYLYDNGYNVSIKSLKELEN